MKTIATLSYLNNINWGGVINNYALLTYITSLGYRCYIINYRKIGSQCSLRARLRNLLRCIVLTNRIKKFKRFQRKRMTLSAKCYYSYSDIINTPLRADLFILGSDQVLNNQQSGNDPSFMMTWANKRIAYSSSLTRNDFSNEELKGIVESLRTFSSVAIREDVNVSMLKNAGLKNVVHVTDPVFLLPREAYIALSQKPRESNYIFAVAYGKVSLMRDNVKVINEKLNLPIYGIGYLRHDYDCKKFLLNDGIEEFIGHLLYAKIVISTSFHTIALCLILHIPFYAIQFMKSDERLPSLMRMAKTEDRLIRYDEVVQSDRVCLNID